MKGYPWYAHHLEDYDRRTGHLSMLQHGAYRLLLDYYYRTGSPLPAKAEHLHRICRAIAKEERVAVDSVVGQYFTLLSDGWHNSRADEEMLKAREISEKRRGAAKKSHKQSASNCSANADTSTITPTKEENIITLNSFVVGKGGQGKPPLSDNYKLAKFQQWLAEKMGEHGWRIVGIAADPANPNYAQAVEQCRRVTKAGGKEWPVGKWPKP